MKKTLLFIAFAACSYVVTAQPDNLTNKKGTNILPEAGQYALGIDAAPIINFFGNTMNGNSNNSYSNSNWTQWNSNLPMTIYGKKCIAADKFYRGRVRIGFGSDKVNFEVTDINTDGDGWPAADTTMWATQYGNDEQKNSYMNITLAAGIEQRHFGSGRIQGYCGPEVWLGFGNSKTTNTFANALDTNNAAVGSPYTFSGAQTYYNGSSARITEVKNPSIFSFGIRGFVGVEYFFMAKASIGFEFGWGIGFETQGATETTIEYYEDSPNTPSGTTDTGTITATTTSPGKNSRFGLDTDNAYGAINMIFYFGPAGSK